MRKIYLILLLMMALGTQTVRGIGIDDSLRYYLRHLTHACCGQGAPFLYDMAAHITKPKFYTPLSYDTSDVANYLNLYNEMFYSAYDTTLQPNYLQWYGTSQQMVNDDTIPVGIFDFQYNIFKDSVFDSVNNYYINPTDTNAWFRWDDTSIYNARVPILPYSDAYKINPATHTRIWEIFVASPLSQTANFRNVVYAIDPSFVFANPSGLLPGGTVKVNFGDGSGWLVIPSLASMQYFNVTYPGNGAYYVQVEVLNDLGTVIKHSMSRITVLRNTISRTPDHSFSIPGATISEYYGCGHSRIERPFIYLEGIDPLENTHAADIYSNVIDGSNLVMLRDFNYDFIIVDWQSSTASIESNAATVINLLETLLSNADSTGNDSNTQFVVMGESMGGVVGRYALATMETPTYLATHPKGHNTREFISLDGPQQGANIPLGMQRMYSTLASIINPLGNDVASLINIGVSAAAFDYLLARPVVRELLIYNDYDRTGAGKYPEDAERATLMSELNTLGYPKHCKTVAITNGLIDSPSRQVTFGNKILRTGMPYFDIDLTVAVNSIWPAPLTYFALTDLEALTSPGFDSTGIILQGAFTRHPFSFYGCLTSILSLGFVHSACYPTVTSSISISADSVQPLDIIPGGYYGLLGSVKPTENDDLNSFWDKLIYVDSINITGTTAYAVIVSPFLPDDFIFRYTGYIDHFCFIPRFSALDYHPLFPAIHADHDIMADNIDTIVKRTPFDVAVGWYGSGSPHFGGYPTFNSNYGDNSYHLTVRDDSVPSDYSHATWLNREVGDDVMNLDNLDINRKAQFHVRDSIIAGWRESPYYTYPTLTGLKTAMYSKQDSFIIDSIGGDVTFKAGHRIILDNYFKAKFGSRFHMILDSDIICNLSYGSLESPPPFLHGNQNNGASTTQDSVQLNHLISKTTSLKVHPNPSNRMFSVILPDSVSGQINVQVVNVYGKIISNFTLTNQNQFTIDAVKYNMAKGIYALIVGTEAKVYSVKLIVN